MILCVPEFETTPEVILVSRYIIVSAWPPLLAHAPRIQHAFLVSCVVMATSSRSWACTLPTVSCFNSSVNLLCLACAIETYKSTFRTSYFEILHGVQRKSRPCEVRKASFALERLRAPLACTARTFELFRHLHLFTRSARLARRTSQSLSPTSVVMYKHRELFSLPFLSAHLTPWFRARNAHCCFGLEGLRILTLLTYCAFMACCTPLLFVPLYILMLYRWKCMPW